jgi:hypothetical protein
MKPGIASRECLRFPRRSGLSRRRSRVRVPSLPFLEVPANRRLMLPFGAATILSGAADGQQSRIGTRGHGAEIPVIGFFVSGLGNRASASRALAPTRTTDDLRSVATPSRAGLCAAGRAGACRELVDGRHLEPAGMRRARISFFAAAFGARRQARPRPGSCARRSGRPPRA